MLCKLDNLFNTKIASIRLLLYFKHQFIWMSYSMKHHFQSFRRFIYTYGWIGSNMKGIYQKYPNYLKNDWNALMSKICFQMTKSSYIVGSFYKHNQSIPMFLVVLQKNILVNILRLTAMLKFSNILVNFFKTLTAYVKNPGNVKR